MGERLVDEARDGPLGGHVRTRGSGPSYDTVTSGVGRIGDGTPVGILSPTPTLSQGCETVSLVPQC